jgi:branched-chain amino acid transport system substrate-binding protein
MKLQLQQMGKIGLAVWLAAGMTVGMAIGNTAAAQSAEALRIGVLTDMTGALADTQGEGSVEAARIAVEEFGGEVLGRKIEVLSGDHQNKPDVGSGIARRWIDTSDVGLILDLGNSAVAIAVQNIVQEKNRISIATGAATGELTNEFCNPNSLQWGYDTYQFTKASTAELVKAGGDTWFFITADYAFGHALENDAKRIVEANGGKVVGAVRHPINTMDFSSYLMQAQASKAKVIAIASAVSDLQNAIKQGNEFQVFSETQKPSAMAMLLVDVHSVGLKGAQGTVLSSISYWDANEATRKFSERFASKMNRPPSETHAMNYSATLHYLKAVREAGTVETGKVLEKMRTMPIEDAFTSKGTIREDGRVMRDIFLVRVKSEAESKKPWDYFEILGRIPAADAFRPVAESVCPLLRAK